MPGVSAGSSAQLALSDTQKGWFHQAGAGGGGMLVMGELVPLPPRKMSLEVPEDSKGGQT